MLITGKSYGEFVCWQDPRADDVGQDSFLAALAAIALTRPRSIATRDSRVPRDSRDHVPPGVRTARRRGQRDLEPGWARAVRQVLAVLSCPRRTARSHALRIHPQSAGPGIGVDAPGAPDVRPRCAAWRVPGRRVRSAAAWVAAGVHGSGAGATAAAPEWARSAPVACLPGRCWLARPRACSMVARSPVPARHRRLRSAPAAGAATQKVRTAESCGG